MKAFRKVNIALAAIVLVVLVAGFAWLSMPLKADSTAYAHMTSPTQTVYLPSGASEQGEIENALVFYPGAKVEPAAYAPLMSKLAEDGWMCITVDAPFHIAFLNMYAAGQVIDSHPNVKNWYVGGHSMGGVAATQYAKKNAEKVHGLVYVASFSPSTIEKDGLDAVFVYGTNDTVLAQEKTQTCYESYGNRARVLVIEGGNHAQFGSYGFQDGDSEATVSAEEQTQLAADFITRKAA